MFLSVNTNTLSSVATRSLNQSSERLTNHTRKLSSGSRINKAGDDVASLSVAVKLETRLKSIGKAKQNIVDAMGHMEAASGAIQKSVDNVQRIRELFVQGLNGTNSVDEKDALQREINELLEAQFNIILSTKVNAGSEESEYITATYMPDFQVYGDFNPFLDSGYIENFQVGVSDDDSYTVDLRGAIVDDGIGLMPGAFSNSLSGLNANQGPAIDGNNLHYLTIPGASIPHWYPSQLLHMSDP